MPRGEQPRPTPRPPGPRTMPKRPDKVWTRGSLESLRELQHWTGPPPQGGGDWEGRERLAAITKDTSQRVAWWINVSLHTIKASSSADGRQRWEASCHALSVSLAWDSGGRHGNSSKGGKECSKLHFSSKWDQDLRGMWKERKVENNLDLKSPFNRDQVFYSRKSLTGYDGRNDGSDIADYVRTRMNVMLTNRGASFWYGGASQYLRQSLG